ncbi:MULTISPECIES: amidohydrolase family protein [unclassified Microbispora]|uniref:amidohydrolase family protein n=1 Tax=unclassified Microbispora TaxID=2614687 RepID=UPI0016035E8F|nr:MULTISPECIES: amidohydrolase family protein [unclassified Microbispora]
MWNGYPVVDADGHVIEPGNLWEEYVDPAFREACLRVERDPSDGDRLLIDGRPSRLIRRLGGVPYDPDEPIVDWNTLERAEYAPFRESCPPASYDGDARVRWLDAEGIEATLLFPSLGLIWPREVDCASPYAVAHLRAYNRWMADFASAAPDRLVPVGQLALSPEAPFPQEVAALAATGFRHVMLPHGVTVLDARLDPFWAAAQDHGMVIHLHKVAVPHLLPLPLPTSVRAPGTGAFFNHVNEILPGQLFLAGLLDARVPDRFPDLRFAFHECNIGWLPAWLERAQESFETLRETGRDTPDHPPRHYLYDRDAFFFSTGLGERLDGLPEELRSRVLLATDFPHPGTPFRPREEWDPVLAAFPEDLRRALLGENALRILDK